MPHPMPTVMTVRPRPPTSGLGAWAFLRAARAATPFRSAATPILLAIVPPSGSPPPVGPAALRPTPRRQADLAAQSSPRAGAFPD
jgi:hypothetical protein